MPKAGNLDTARLCAEMVESQIRARGIEDPRVLEAMRAVPRHEFVGAEYQHLAYEDRPLPIGAGQTISQPYMVAAMSEALALKGNETVLDVGTGSGYQAAVLAHLAGRVYSIERERLLLEVARATLARLGLAVVAVPQGGSASPGPGRPRPAPRAGASLDVADRVILVEGDGTQGYAPGAPYDGIVVGAGAPDVPASLVEQLADGGRLVIPVGDLQSQELLLVRKVGEQATRSVINYCRFVPLVGEQGWRK